MVLHALSYLVARKQICPPSESDIRSSILFVVCIGGGRGWLAAEDNRSAMMAERGDVEEKTYPLDAMVGIEPDQKVGGSGTGNNRASDSGGVEEYYINGKRGVMGGQCARTGLCREKRQRQQMKGREDGGE